MCCYTNKLFWSAIALMSAALWAMVGPAFAAEPAERYLDVWSKGSSRFEISEGDVIAVFGDGVEFEYLGCHAVAQTMRYNQATQVATASGDVVLKTSDADLATQEIVFDGHQGLLELRDGVSGQLAASGYSFNATEAEVEFDPDDPSFALENIELRLMGTVTLTSAAGDMLLAGDIDYSGSTGEFFSMAPFSLTAAASHWSTDDQSPLDLTGLQMYGTELRGKFDGTKGLTELTAKNLSISAAGLEVTLGSAALGQLTFDDSRKHLHSAQLEISKPEGWLQPRTGRRITLKAGGGKATADEDGIASVELNDGVNLQYLGMPLEAESVVLVRLADGLGLRMPGDVAVEFNLADLAGVEPVSGTEWQTQLAR